MCNYIESMFIEMHTSKHYVILISTKPNLI